MTTLKVWCSCSESYALAPGESLRCSCGRLVMRRVAFQPYRSQAPLPRAPLASPIALEGQASEPQGFVVLARLSEDGALLPLSGRVHDEREAAEAEASQARYDAQSYIATKVVSAAGSLGSTDVAQPRSERSDGRGGAWRRGSVAPKRREPWCRDCGEQGELTGHMGCQYPQDRE